MAMTKKHYEMVAKILKRENTRVGGDDGMIESIATLLAIEFKLDNPNFDRTKFLKACGVQA